MTIKIFPIKAKMEAKNFYWEKGCFKNKIDKIKITLGELAIMLLTKEGFKKYNPCW